MTSSARWWFATFVALVFIAGMAGGVVADRVWLLRPGPGPGVRPDGPPRAAIAAANLDRIAAVNIDRLDRELNLTAEQRAKLAPIFQEWLRRVQTLQGNARVQLRGEMRTFEAQVAGVLTPDQADRFARLRGDLMIPAMGRRFQPPGRGAGRGGPPGPRAGGAGMQ